MINMLIVKLLGMQFGIAIVMRKANAHIAPSLTVTKDQKDKENADFKETH